MDIGITLPGHGHDIVAYAQHAEGLGLESLWHGDHLIPVNPYLDSTLVHATAAAVTTRIKLGFGVMVVALRQPAWTAKQIATLQHLSADRVLLGVGSGGEAHGEAAWHAVDVPFAERGRRTDAVLEVLPGLVRGERVPLHGHEIALSPGATMPPVLVGGGGKAALRRAARFGDHWYPAFVPHRAVVSGLGQLGRLAAEYGRPRPGVTVGVGVALGDVPASVIDARIKGMTDYGLPAEQAREVLVTGTPAQAAERFAELAEAGADRVIAMPFTEDRFRQAELVAAAGVAVMDQLGGQRGGDKSAWRPAWR
ncbi:alkanesulfonate monooxygenase SsuD/methylene tetrahydromethanopterin reductase-like flavin-dependent oxidoreductase (luciferase family) [Saccharothrix tamanrassetensis]|uniref:Alkanesulfonate monooxygenase SsuD/methylene tetrahydromethanopterin reductase-like flavin-dependent oxidoreductase (Luciferase family) n=1 Tax=Saccharothrix tamanrassetensis TaxID=1051531 RepID=A0A841CSV0_9PSEU|nr:LLM class flavin-dependent oxidoreductase [Saccharothrix tamanrassetensis]MBB5959228.1 alkanesulfonate monooxygenase SsuD/methylene tetrahydromethanopterin reductase-like flavin-dependent oxidoreductase (luciferase family) [Saccharothrix tamanrassetensis]